MHQSERRLNASPRDAVWHVLDSDQPRELFTRITRHHGVPITTA